MMYKYVTATISFHMRNIYIMFQVLDAMCSDSASIHEITMGLGTTGSALFVSSTAKHPQRINLPAELVSSLIRCVALSAYTGDTTIQLE